MLTVESELQPVAKTHTERLQREHGQHPVGQEDAG
jgi:hypothetical protein